MAKMAGALRRCLIRDDTMRIAGHHVQHPRTPQSSHSSEARLLFENEHARLDARTVRVKEDRKGVLEIVLLIGATLGTTLLPLIWVATGFPARADYPLHPVPCALGLLAMAAGLWLRYRSHTDLGTNWSLTLQTRGDHRLVTAGIYKRIRHPMVALMFLLGIAHLLFVPNWIVAPAYLLTFGMLYVFRVAREERMMLDRFGSDYQT